MRNVVQLGLGGTPIFINLSLNHWMTHWLSDEIPAFFKNNAEPFVFYGVDYSPSSISRLSKVYARHEFFKDSDRIHWICCGISNKIELTIPSVSFQYDTEVSVLYGEHAKNNLNIDPVTGEHEFYGNNFIPYMPLNVLIDFIGLDTLDILAIDIDGYELAIFNNFKDWQIKPKFISIELHNRDYLRGGYSHFLQETGYDNVEKYPIDFILRQLDGFGYSIYGTKEHVRPPDMDALELKLIRS